MNLTTLIQLIPVPYIPSFHVSNKNLYLMNWQKINVASKRRTKNKGISILVWVELSLTLWKATQNLIVNVYKHDKIIKMLDIFMFVQFGGIVFETDDRCAIGYRCIDDVLSLNSSGFCDYPNLIFPKRSLE